MQILIHQTNPDFSGREAEFFLFFFNISPSEYVCMHRPLHCISYVKASYDGDSLVSFFCFLPYGHGGHDERDHALARAKSGSA